MTDTHEAVTHWFPTSVADRRPSAWWYWGRAVYVSRRDYWKIMRVFLAVGIPLGTVGVLFHISMAFRGAVALAEIGLLLLVYSLFACIACTATQQCAMCANSSRSATCKAK